MGTDPRARVAARVDRYWPFINELGQGHKVAQSWIQAIIHEESGGNPVATRDEPRLRDASYGLMQVLCRTARGLGFSGPCAQLLDPRRNIAYGTRFFHDLLARYAEPGAALAHYNGGPKAARAWRRGKRRTLATRYAQRVLALAAFYAHRNRALGR